MNFGREEFIYGFSFLGIATSADVSSGFVHHPQFCDWFLYLQSVRGEGFEVRGGGYEHVLVYSFAVNSDESQFDEILGLSSGADGFEAEVLGEADCVGGLVGYKGGEGVCELIDYFKHIIINDGDVKMINQYLNIFYFVIND